MNAVDRRLGAVKAKRSKYGVRLDEDGKRERTVDSILFASKREALRYITLKQMQRAGQIRGLKLQPKFDLGTVAANGIQVRVARYIADFEYTTDKGEWVVEDSKGKDTAMSKLKRKWLKLQSGIDVVLV